MLRGAARKTVCARPSHHWNEEVAGRLDALLLDPANQRRYENVYNALKSEFEFRVDDERRPLLPPRKAVETRMLNIWKKTKKEARDAAQNSAARDVARAARAAGVAAVDDDEVPSSDDDADDPVEMDTSPDGDADADGGADGGADAANDDPTDGYMAQLAGVGVRELRRRLREERGDSTPLASVRAADLAPSDLRTGESKAQATLDLLRQRLATVLAGGSP